MKKLLLIILLVSNLFTAELDKNIYAGEMVYIYNGSNHTCVLTSKQFYDFFKENIKKGNVAVIGREIGKNGRIVMIKYNNSAANEMQMYLFSNTYSMCMAYADLKKYGEDGVKSDDYYLGLRDPNLVKLVE